ncbi:MAG: hypothetical protein J0M18_13700 [Ignavibacteria bacterium]|nr:hypothetical protein [Ignavibacteria bacterium]
MKTNPDSSSQKNFTSTKLNSKEEKQTQLSKEKLPPSVIPGQDAFNKKRLQDIENERNNYKKTRVKDAAKASPLKIVKKLFKKKK